MRGQSKPVSGDRLTPFASSNDHGYLSSSRIKGGARRL